MNLVLSLNASWQPVRFIDKFDAISHLFSGKAKALDENYIVYNWEQWCENWADADKVKLYSHGIMSSPNMSIPVPKVIILCDRKTERASQFARLSRRNLFARDNNTCQYCGKKGPREKMNIDHVVPRAQGGKTIWTNVVLSCYSCNHNKGARTPEEAGMKLKRKPVRPVWHSLHREIIIEQFSDWKSLFDEIYWNTTLQE